MENRPNQKFLLTTVRHPRVGFWVVDSLQNRQFDALRVFSLVDHSREMARLFGTFREVSRKKFGLKSRRESLVETWVTRIPDKTVDFGTDGK